MRSPVCGTLCSSSTVHMGLRSAASGGCDRVTIGRVLAFTWLLCRSMIFQVTHTPIDKALTPGGRRIHPAKRRDAARIDAAFGVPRLSGSSTASEASGEGDRRAERQRSEGGGGGGHRVDPSVTCRPLHHARIRSHGPPPPLRGGGTWQSLHRLQRRDALRVDAASTSLLCHRPVRSEGGASGRPNFLLSPEMGHPDRAQEGRATG